MVEQIIDAALLGLATLVVLLCLIVSVAGYRRARRDRRRRAKGYRLTESKQTRRPFDPRIHVSGLVCASQMRAAEPGSMRRGIGA